MLACGGCHQSLCFLSLFPWVVGCSRVQWPLCLFARCSGVGWENTAEAPVGLGGRGGTDSRLQLSDLPSLSRTRGPPRVRPMRMGLQGLCAVPR